MLTIIDAYQYVPRSVNASKALSNWEKKSKYLLAELIKYQTYVDALWIAKCGRQKKRDETKVSNDGRMVYDITLLRFWFGKGKATTRSRR